MPDAVDAGAYNVGGPRAHPGGPLFSDVTHHKQTHKPIDNDTRTG